ncbi:MAG TPA: prolyl oligopeptidase family serine peptidase [Longimicrobiales bacterium]|nr:prolyl oligopeptidase family serine peptidase [Longimicrobiales bacterium]
MSTSRSSGRGLAPALLASLVLLASALPGVAPALSAQGFTIEDILSPQFPVEMASARSVDRIAWIAFERGTRNVYTAVGPDFAPVRLTNWMDDRGHDLTDINVSDDGDVLVFVRGHTPNSQGWIANPFSDPRGSERAIWAIGSAGGDPWRVAEGSSPVLSPDGHWVLFVKGGQIWRAAVNPGVEAAEPAEPLFRTFGVNSDPVWSPDGKSIAFTSVREDHSYIGIYDTEVPKVSYLAPGVDRDDQPVWSPDGKQVAFVRRPGLPFGTVARRPPSVPDSIIPKGLQEARFAGGANLALWIADVGTGKGHEVWHNMPYDSAFSRVTDLMWGDQALVFKSEPGNWEHYYSVPVAGHGGLPTDLTPGEGFVEMAALSRDGRNLYFAGNMGDIHRRDLFKVATRGGSPQQLTKGAMLETYPAALASDRQVAVLLAGPSLPQSVGLVPSNGGEGKAIMPLPQRFPKNKHVVPENVTLKAADGFEFYNEIFLPPDLKPGERRPAMIFIHGGSRRQMLLGYHYMHFYHMAYAMNQYFANKGYVVLSVNYRSGIGYGKAFRDTPGIGRRGNKEYQDILAAGLYLQGRPDVDPKRVGLWGLSYGGILTAQGLARNSDVFVAGVDIAGAHFWGEALDPSQVNYSSSSASEVDKWTSPVLLIQGDDDRNVDFSQTVGLVQALRANDVYFELIVYPDEVHDFLVFSRWLETFGATDDFFDRFLWNKKN